MISRDVRTLDGTGVLVLAKFTQETNIEAPWRGVDAQGLLDMYWAAKDRGFWAADSGFADWAALWKELGYTLGPAGAVLSPIMDRVRERAIAQLRETNKPLADALRDMSAVCGGAKAPAEKTSDGVARARMVHVQLHVAVISDYTDGEDSYLVLEVPVQASTSASQAGRTIEQDSRARDVLRSALQRLVDAEGAAVERDIVAAIASAARKTPPRDVEDPPPPQRLP